MTGDDDPDLTDGVLLSAAERLTRQFYEWERRGRGWETWDREIRLEPPYRPFYGHYLRTPVIDDGRTATLLSALADRLLGRNPQRVESAESDEERDEEPEPEAIDDPLPDTEIAISLPRDASTDPESTERFLLSASRVVWRIAFEIVATSDAIRTQFVVPRRDRRRFLGQLQAFFPHVRPAAAPPLLHLWRKEGDAEGAVVEFGLSREFMVSLRTFRNLDPDPLLAVIGALGEIGRNEVAVLQVLFEPTAQPWAENVLRAVTDGQGGSFFADAPHFVAQAAEKVSHPLLGTVLRLGARSPGDGRAWEILRALSGALVSFGGPTGNELMPLAFDDTIDLEEDLLARSSHRTGMLLSSRELLGLVHLPSSSVRSQKLRPESRRTKAAPALSGGSGVILGSNIHENARRTISVSREQRLRHMYVIGASGTGKSTLLLSLALQDIERGDGVAVIDPHGDLADELLGRIPASHIDDVLVFDPADRKSAAGFNLLHANNDLEKTLLASDLVAVFRRLSTSWGDQMQAVLGNAIQAFLESSKGGTLSDLRHFLIDREFREDFLSTVRDPDVVFFWRKEFPLLVGRPQGSILTRLDAFLRPRSIRAIVTSRGRQLDFRKILDERKIFVARLSQGAIGEDNAALLGSVIVSKFHQAAMSRQDIPPSSRRDFFMYLDEFQNFATPSMASLLSSARKYSVGLTLAHQDLRQLRTEGGDLASAVLTNPCTRVCFRVGETDAKVLEVGFSYFRASDLLNLGVGEAICRLEHADHDFNLKTLPLPSIAAAAASERRDQIIALSRKNQGIERREVEAAAPVEETVLPARVSTAAENPVSSARPAVVESRKPPKEYRRTIPVEERPVGRGGAEHRYLQELVKRWAEGRGYRSTIEKETAGGGRVDVALEREGFSLACEISVTSTPEYELGNIEKCLAAGFDRVIVLSREKKILTSIFEKALSVLPPESQSRILFLTPEEFFASLDALPPGPTTDGIVRGYKVRVGLRPVTRDEKESRLRAVSEVIASSLKKLKRGG